MTEIMIEKFLEGNVRALAKTITQVENREPGYDRILEQLYPYTGKAWIIGITGSPGVGKSSLTDALISHLRHQEKTVGVVAIDPTSPFSGGALLGDRIRMQSHTLDRGVYIRSIANRGFSGGIALATKDIVRVIDAYGRDVIFVETTGVGQTELAVMDIVDVTVLILSPEAGDDIQAIKAGIMEIADIFVINKADLKGASKLKVYIEKSLHMSKRQMNAPVFMTETLVSKGIAQLWDGISNWLEVRYKNGQLEAKRQAHLENEMLYLLKDGLFQQLQDFIEQHDTLAIKLKNVQARQITPIQASQELLSQFLNNIN